MENTTTRYYPFKEFAVAGTVLVAMYLVALLSTDAIRLYLFKQSILIIALFSTMYLVGALAVKTNIKINYTRKIVHFVGFVNPMIIETIFPLEGGHTLKSFIMGFVIWVGIMLVFVEPIRRNSPLIRRMFVSFDRPEDRPYTLLWFVSQMIASYIVLCPFFLYFQSENWIMLAAIPILVNGVGDGLAEPVGVRFGKHKYRVHALFTRKKYIRSLEGSACVFATTVFAVIGFQGEFTSVQFCVALATLPITMTLAEALSPHTWDSPFLMFVGFSVLYLVKLL